MRVIVVGLGVQGRKRSALLGDDYVACVDPVVSEANYQKIEDVPLDTFDAALLCVPDEAKIELISYLLTNYKHVLVEKPLWALEDQDIRRLETLALSKGMVCYTAYNHRFEPHFIRMKNLIESGELGDIYHCRLFYGNGTARLVQKSAWRDQGGGVLPDLGSHLLDTADYWFGIDSLDFSIVSSNRFENKAPDHVVFTNKKIKPQLEMEMTLLSWRNHFTCDILAEKGSAHITSLCKWGPSTFIHRKRQLPSGRPDEESITLTQPDPTWLLEYQHFINLCQTGWKTDLSREVWLNRVMTKLSKEALRDV